MSATDLLFRAAVLAGGMALLAAGGCATAGNPPGSLPEPTRAGATAYGGWITLQRKDREPVAGELIAVGADTVWVLQRLGAEPFATAEIAGGQLAMFNAASERVAAATVLGLLSTVSNGAFLIFTAPIWLIGGIASASAQSRAPLRRLPPPHWGDLAPFARFPQGLPPGLDPRTLGRPFAEKALTQSR